MSFGITNIAPGVAPLPVKGIANIQGKGQQKNDNNIINPASNSDFFATKDVVELSEPAKLMLSKAYQEEDVSNYREETSVDLRNDGVSNTNKNIFKESQNEIRAASKFKAEVELKKVLSDIIYEQGSLLDELI